MIILNKTTIETSQFPNGETNILTKISNIAKCDENVIEFFYEDDKDLILLMMVKMELDNLGFKNTLLVIKYMPYSRMDRSENGSVFTLKHVSKLINSLNFQEIYILEPHSDVTPALIDRCIVCKTSEYIADVCIDKEGLNHEKDVIYYPDATAYKRYSKNFSYFKYQLVGNKVRDFETGKILSLEVTGNLPKGRFNAIMVDDLCSRGGTFMLGAVKLNQLGANKIYLAVTHCENSIFDGDILKTDLIDKVYCSDTMIHNQTHDKLIVCK